VEETPPARFAELTSELGDAAVAMAKACGYTNAGTVEFLVDEDGRFYFLEVNARLQVEHTITEEVLGIDLVACQLRVAAQEALGLEPAGMEPRGPSIECRINAADPARSFAPSPGRITRYREPGGPGVRVDSGYGEGDEIPGAYDSLVAKLIVWAPSREEARRRMLRALGEFAIEGVATTIPAHELLLSSEAFADGSYTTRTIEEGALDGLRTAAETAAAESGAVLLVEGRPVRLWNPAMASQAAGATTRTASGGDVVSPMHGTILDVLVKAGDEIEAGQAVAVLEAMKMETYLQAAKAGRVSSVAVAKGAVVESGEVVATVEST
jgi:acetyl-CoA/propionyl-CoA carboxylase biotin carboxyl carrier protein